MEKTKAAITELSGLVPILETNDLKQSVEYYKTILGFECKGMWPEDAEPCWASLKCGEVVIMLVVRNTRSDIAKPTFTGSLYLYPENVDQAWKELKDKVDVCYEIETFDYGMREFGIYDCNGYLLQFGQGVEAINGK